MNALELYKNINALLQGRCEGSFNGLLFFPVAQLSFSGEGWPPEKLSEKKTVQHVEIYETCVHWFKFSGKKKSEGLNVTWKSELGTSVTATEITAVYEYANAGHATLV